MLIVVQREQVVQPPLQVDLQVGYTARQVVKSHHCQNKRGVSCFRAGGRAEGARKEA